MDESDTEQCPANNHIPDLKIEKDFTACYSNEAGDLNEQREF